MHVGLGDMVNFWAATVVMPRGVHGNEAAESGEIEGGGGRAW